MSVGSTWTVLIPPLPVSQQRHVARSHVVTIKLVPLSAANILREQNVIPAMWMKSSAANGVREKRQLLALSARHLHQMKLRGVPKPCGNQHLALRGMPVREAGTAIRCVSASRLRQRRRYLRHSIHDQIVGRSDDGILRVYGREQKQREC